MKILKTWEEEIGNWRRTQEKTLKTWEEDVRGKKTKKNTKPASWSKQGTGYFIYHIFQICTVFHYSTKGTFMSLFFILLVSLTVLSINILLSVILQVLFHIIHDNHGPKSTERHQKEVHCNATLWICFFHHWVTKRREKRNFNKVGPYNGALNICILQLIKFCILRLGWWWSHLISFGISPLMLPNNFKVILSKYDRWCCGTVVCLSPASSVKNMLYTVI